MKIIVVNHVTLDGVMQAPARADEDTRGGFQHGGWALPYQDEAIARAMGLGQGARATMLFGRRTYEDLAAAWSGRTDNPFSPVLDNAHKYVASNTLAEPLPWRNSTLLSGDVPAAVARLKQELDGDVVILGSGTLIHSLMRHELIDELRLAIHPLVLGTGLRVFGDGVHAKLRLVDATPTTTGVLVTTYARA